MQKINELQLAKELIRFPSVTKIDAGVIKFLEKKLKKIGFKTKILEFKDKNSYPVKNLYAKLGTASPNFCYAGHLDVVPPGNLNDWTVNPFKPAVKKGYLIGSMNGKLSVIGIQGHVAYPNKANNPSTALVQILKELKEIKFDKGTKDFQPTNLEITKINIDNSADNVIPGLASASFNIRFNNKHTSYKLKNKINKIIKQICKKNKSKYKIEYSVSGEAFLTKPNKTTFMIQNIIKKITKIKPQLSTTGGTSDARFIRKIAPCLEFGLVGKTMHKVGECVSLSDLKRLTLIYTKILDNYFK